MGLRFILFVISAGLAWGNFTAADVPFGPLGREWRARSNAILAQLVPKIRGSTRTGVGVQALANILGVSAPFVGNCLNHSNYHFAHEHLLKIAYHFQIPYDSLLPAELLDLYPSFTDLEIALVNEPIWIRKLLAEVYARRHPERVILAPWSAESAFVRRWRDTIHQRLVETLETHGSSVAELAEALGVQMARAAQFAKNYQTMGLKDGDLIGRHYGVSASWLMGADMFDEIKDGAHLGEILSGAESRVRQILLKLYAERRGSCVSDFSVAKP